MEVAIIGLPKSGKTTIFNALTKGKAEVAAYTQASLVPNIGVSKVPEPRLEILENTFRPKKITQTEIRYVDIADPGKSAGKNEGIAGQFLNYLSGADALLQVIRSFIDDNVPHLEGTIDTKRDISTMDIELIFSDLKIIEKRLARIESSLKGAKSAERDSLIKEQILLRQIKSELEKDKPIWQQQLTTEELKSLSSYQFLTAKPTLIVVNIGEDQISEASSIEAKLRSICSHPQFEIVALCGKLEMELAQLSEADDKEFREAMGLHDSAPTRVIEASYRLLGLISFFTTVSSELKVWTIPKGTTALKAAGKIHTDIEKGFIRAEVISYEDLKKCGNLAEARKLGLLRLEGKNYLVKDGDIITFLFNV